MASVDEAVDTVQLCPSNTRCVLFPGWPKANEAKAIVPDIESRYSILATGSIPECHSHKRDYPDQIEKHYNYQVSLF